MVDFNMSAFLTGGTQRLIDMRDASERTAAEIAKEERVDERRIAAEERAATVAKNAAKLLADATKASDDKKAAATVKAAAKKGVLEKELKAVPTAADIREAEKLATIATTHAEVVAGLKTRLKKIKQAALRKGGPKAEKIAMNSPEFKRIQAQINNSSTPETLAAIRKAQHEMDRTKVTAGAKTATQKGPSIQQQKHITDIMYSYQLEMKEAFGIPDSYIVGKRVIDINGLLSTSIRNHSNKVLVTQSNNIDRWLRRTAALYADKPGKTSTDGMTYALDLHKALRTKADHYIDVVEKAPAVRESIKKLFQNLNDPEGREIRELMTVEQMEKLNAAMEGLMTRIEQKESPAKDPNAASAAKDPNAASAKPVDTPGVLETLKDKGQEFYNSLGEETKKGIQNTRQSVIDKIKRILGSIGFKNVPATADKQAPLTGATSDNNT